MTSSSSSSTLGCQSQALWARNHGYGCSSRREKVLTSISSSFLLSLHLLSPHLLFLILPPTLSCLFLDSSFPTLDVQWRNERKRLVVWMLWCSDVFMKQKRAVCPFNSWALCVEQLLLNIHEGMSASWLAGTTSQSQSLHNSPPPSSLWIFILTVRAGVCVRIKPDCSHVLDFYTWCEYNPFLLLLCA